MLNRLLTACLLPLLTLLGGGSLNAAESVPGGLYLHPLPDDAVSVRYRDQPVLIYRQVAIVGIHLNAEPGTHKIRVERADGSHQWRQFSVAGKTYTEQHLTIENPRMVNPLQQDLARIREESARMRAEYERFSEQPGSPQPFILPVDGPMSSSFGRRRVLNGQPRAPHSGLDIAAVEGTPIISPAAGVVTLTGDFYFNGNTVFVDHGQGLISMMCHLSSIDVAEGQRVERGELLGLVGATGRVTGAHLHWSVSMNGNRVDPVMVMQLFSEQAADP